MNMIFLTFVFPLIGFLLLSPTRSEAACARHESAAK